jgi:NAD(P) transhydrogenase subunit alpha
MFSQNIYNLLKYLVKNDSINLDMTDEITQSILVCHDGQLVHQGTIEAMASTKA